MDYYVRITDSAATLRNAGLVMIQNFEELCLHEGHVIRVVTYGWPIEQNVSIECADCNQVLIDFEREE